jgi:hypothetical protein
MLTLPTLLRDTSLAALAMSGVALAGAAEGAWSRGSAVAVVVGTLVTCLNLWTLGWAVSGMEHGDFQRRLLFQQVGLLLAVVTFLVARLPALGFTIGFMCFFPCVAARAFVGLRRPTAQEIG